MDFVTSVEDNIITLSISVNKKYYKLSFKYDDYLKENIKNILINNIKSFICDGVMFKKYNKHYKINCGNFKLSLNENVGYDILECLHDKKNVTYKYHNRFLEDNNYYIFLSNVTKNKPSTFIMFGENNVLNYKD